MIKGVDIGGTFVKVAYEDGKKKKFFIGDVKNSKRKLLERLKEIILDDKPSGVGIAVAGFISKDGTITRSPNLPVLDGVNPREIFKVPKIVVDNDVNMAGYCEWKLHNSGSEVLLAIILGTGLGSGLVINGEVFRGAGGSALELGHHIIEKGGRPCSCGRRGCWEAYCSSYGIVNIYRDLGGSASKDIEIIWKARSGDERALETIKIFKEYLLIGLANAVHILNPDTLVLGGGLIEGMKDFLYDIEEKLKSRVESLPASVLKVRFSVEKEFAGAVGALLYLRAVIRKEENRML